jgi:hypothetical protein
MGGGLAAAGRETIEHRGVDTVDLLEDGVHTPLDAVCTCERRQLADHLIAGDGGELGDPRMGGGAARGRRRRDEQLLDRSGLAPPKARHGRARHRPPW